MNGAPAGRRDGDHPAAGRPLRLAGRVEAGVEHGSVVLRGDDGRTWQVGARWGHLAGRRVVVEGVPRPGLLTTAQQGTPLAVREAATEDGVPLEPRPAGGRQGDQRGGRRPEGSS